MGTQAGPDDPLSGFGLDGDDDRWLAEARAAEKAQSGGRLGAYELSGEVKHGGQGVVFRARQPGTNRDVALKRLLAGSFATPQMLRRFEREVEIVAALDHPGVVRIYGVEELDGGPVLVLQWIDGRPADEWARPAGVRRPIRELVLLVREICAAVQHAHRHGVIHRDLKPSNILVDGQGRPHVLDFGLAKLTREAQGPELAETITTDFTGTPAFSSPEQVRLDGAPLDVRTDVYSLGVVTYLLLTGRFPYALGRHIADTVRAIEQAEPDPPSRHAPDVDRELGTILLKCLAKDREQRYSSIEALSDDLGRYLRGDAIAAHAPSRLYLARKFARRHWFGIGLTAALIAFLIALVLIFAAQKQRVLDEKERLETVFSFLTEDLLEALGPLGKDLPVSVAFQFVGPGLEERFERHPAELARLRGLTGAIYTRLGFYRRAENQVRKAIAGLAGTEDAELAQARQHLLLASVLGVRGAWLEAEVQLQTAGRLAALQPPGGREIELEARRLSAELAIDAGDLLRARATILELLHQGSEALDPERDLARDWVLAARLDRELGAFDLAHACLERARELHARRKVWREVHLALDQRELARLETARGEDERALEALLWTQAVLAKELGPTHSVVHEAGLDVASAFVRLGRTGGMEELIDAAERTASADHGECSALESEARWARIQLRLAQGRSAEARALHAQALDEVRGELQGGDGRLEAVAARLIACGIEQSWLGPTRAALEALAAGRSLRLDPAHPLLAETDWLAGRLAGVQGDPGEAARRQEQASAHLRACAPHALVLRVLGPAAANRLRSFALDEHGRPLDATPGE